MAVRTPLYINQIDYDAETERRGFAGLVAQSVPGVARTGVLGPAPAVSLSGSTVQVGPFNAVIGSSKGAYLVAVDAVTAAGTIGVADATNGRLDRVVLEVLDPDNGSAGTTRLGRLRVIPGEAKAIPGLPALPPLALHVAQVLVPKSGAGNPVVTVDPPFTAAAGAPVPVRSQAERDALPLVNGMQALRLDTPGRDVDVCTGLSWLPGGTDKQPISLTYLYSADPPRADGLPQEPPSVYRAGRRVHLSGVASNVSRVEYSGFVEYSLGRLPEGFRPARVEYFTIESAFTLCRVYVRPDGNIYFIFSVKVGPLEPRLWRFSFSGISFDAAP